MLQTAGVADDAVDGLAHVFGDVGRTGQLGDVLVAKEGIPVSAPGKKRVRQKTKRVQLMKNDFL